MNTSLFFLALTQFILSLVLGVTLLYFAFRLASRWLKHHMADNNMAMGIFTGAVLLSTGMILSWLIQPILHTIRELSKMYAETTPLILNSAKYIGLFLLIGLAVAAIVNVVAVMLFNTLNKNVKELEELKQNNVTVGIISGVILIAITLIVQDAVVVMVESFVPYPTGPVY